MNSKVCIAISAAAVVVGGSAQAAVLNGSFESPDVPGGFSTTIDGWANSAGTGVDGFNSGYPGIVGDQFAYMGHAGNYFAPTNTFENIFQDFLIDDTSSDYLLTINLDTFFSGGGNQGNIVIGIVNLTTLSGNSLTIAPLTLGDFAGFATYSVNLGSGGTAGDTFRVYVDKQASVGAYNLLVDNVAVTAVPEPGTFVSVLGGLGMLAMFRRRRA